MSDQSVTEICRRCIRPIVEFCGSWLDRDTEDETCFGGEHEPAHQRSEAERIGFSGYDGCPGGPCTGTLASECLASGDCARLALLDRLNRGDQ